MRMETGQRVEERPGLAAGVFGATLLLTLAAMRIAARFEGGRVSFFGYEQHWGCWFRQRYGLPCPACGMTRSVILTLNGRFAQAMQMNAAGMLGCLGVMLLGMALLYLMFRQRRSTKADHQRLEGRVRVWTLMYGGLLVLCWSSQWLWRISGHGSLVP